MKSDYLIEGRRPRATLGHAGQVWPHAVRSVLRIRPFSIELGHISSAGIWDDFGGPYDAIVADAVLHHLSGRQFDEVLNRARQAVMPDGIVAFTLKEGDGDGRSHATIRLPRHFTYWREPDVRSALERAGWSATSIVPVQGRSEPWLFVIACKARPADG